MIFHINAISSMSNVSVLWISLSGLHADMMNNTISSMNAEIIAIFSKIIQIINSNIFICHKLELKIS